MLTNRPANARSQTSGAAAPTASQPPPRHRDEYTIGNKSLALVPAVSVVKFAIEVHGLLALAWRDVAEEDMLRVAFVKSGEYPAGSPPFAVQQLSHRRVRLVGGDEHPGRGCVAESCSHQGPPGSVPPPGWGDVEQVDEVAAIEMAWPEYKEAGDLAVLHDRQAVLFFDEGMNLPGGAEPARVHGHDGAGVLCPRCAYMHTSSIGRLAVRPSGAFAPGRAFSLLMSVTDLPGCKG